MKYETIAQTLPDVSRAVVALSGGMDSTIVMRVAVARYGAENISAVTFDYGQKNAHEIEKARASTAYLGVKHRVIDARFLRDISLGFSAIVDPNIAMPTLEEAALSRQPKTYVPNLNAILLSIAAAYAETVGAEAIFCGLQEGDEYSYHDCTPIWVGKLNALLDENRTTKIRVYAPFVYLRKRDVLAVLKDIGDLGLLRHTLTCYAPNEAQESCGKCPACAERIAAFVANGLEDPIPYSVNIDW